MAVVSPEHDPLAGAITLPPPPSDDARPAPARRRVAATRAPIRPHARTPLHVADYSLALGPVETRAAVTPDIAYSAARSTSSSVGNAPREYR